MTGQPQTEKFLDILRGPLADSGVDLEDIEISTAGRRRVVRVLIDKDGGVSLDEIADATHRVSAALDAADAFGDAPYTLEVTSPGVDRPLTLPRHWHRNTDRLVTVKFVDGSSSTGRVLAATDEGATLQVSGDVRRVTYSEIAKATVQVEFNRRGPSARE